MSETKYCPCQSKRNVYFIDSHRVLVFPLFHLFDFVLFLMSKKTVSIQSLSCKSVFFRWLPFGFFAFYLFSVCRKLMEMKCGWSTLPALLIPFNTTQHTAPIFKREKQSLRAYLQQHFVKYEGEFKRLIQLPIIILFAIDISVTRKAAQFRIERL